MALEDLVSTEIENTIKSENKDGSEGSIPFILVVQKLRDNLCIGKVLYHKDFKVVLPPNSRPSNSLSLQIRLRQNLTDPCIFVSQASLFVHKLFSSFGYAKSLLNLSNKHFL